MKTLVRMVATLLVVATVSGCGDDDQGATTSTTNTPDTTTSTTTPPDDDEVTEEAVDGFSERSATFANLTYTVLDARVSNQDLRSYAEGSEPEVGDRLHLILDVQVENPTGRQLESDGDAIAVELGSAPSGVVDDFLTDAVGLVAANDAVDGFLAFEIEADADPTEAVLVFGSDPDRPTRLPLTGPIPDPGFPVTFSATGTADGVGPTNGGTIRFELIAGALYEDLPHGDTTSPTGERADEGEVFVQLHVRATKVAGRGNDLLGPTAFRLLVDGVPRGAFDVAVAADGSAPTPTAVPGVTVDAWVLFVVDPGADTYVLESGDLAESPGGIPVEIPAG